MSSSAVLICDDNEAVHESLSAYLERAGLRVVSAYTGEDALSILKLEKIDLVILDIMMPGMSGTEVCKQIRSKSSVPIIMLSALGEELDRILGLELGADDYVTKPFSPREVATRVQVVLKRACVPQPEPKLLSFHELVLDLEARCVTVRGRRIECTPKEWSLFALFVRNAGTALSRDRIMNEIWGYDYYGDTRAVDALVKRLRRKLPARGLHFKIATVYGFGYRLEENEEK